MANPLKIVGYLLMGSQMSHNGFFLGPVIAGVLRNSFSWAWVFYACAFIVAVNPLWRPFYPDPTQDADQAEALEDQATSLGMPFRSVSRLNAASWAVPWSAALIASVAYWVKVAQKGEVLIEWTHTLWALLFTISLVVTVAGLFQPRVLWFCILFAGFWLMLNQVFDLLPNVIEDWVNTAGILASLGEAFTSQAVVGALSVAFELLMAFVAAASVLLAMRPDRRLMSRCLPRLSWGWRLRAGSR